MIDVEDCGSWAIDAKTRKWLGVVLEVRKDTVWLIRADRILQQVREQSKLRLELYSSDSDTSTLTPPEHSPMEKRSKEKTYPRLPPREESLDYKICCFRVRKYFKAKTSSSNNRGTSTLALESGFPKRSLTRSKTETFSINLFSPPSAFADSAGTKFGSIHGDTLWKLQGPYEYYWQEIRPLLEDIVRRTPPKSQNETSPVVHLHGYMAGTEQTNALPTVAIMCSSASYANQLKKAVLHSGLLDRYNFQCRVLNGPILKSA